MALSIVIAADYSATPVVTLSEAKQHLDVTHFEEDEKITGLLVTATELVETMLDRTLLNTTYQLRLYSFPPGRIPIILPKPPMISVTSVQYLDENDVLQTWALGSIDITSPIGPMALHGNIRPLVDEFYPHEKVSVDAIQITYTAGYASAAAVPEPIKTGIKMVLNDLYNNPGSDVIGTIRVGSTRTAEDVMSRYSARRFDLRYDAD